MYRLITIIRNLSTYTIKNLNTKSLISTRINQISPILLKQYHQLPKTPDLIYIPNIGRWLNCKLKLKFLKYFYDRDFHEGEFIYGSIYAICRITKIINNENINELNGLLTDISRMKLIHDVNNNLTTLQKQIILLKPEDIKIIIPLSVHINSNKICRITLRVLGIKWYQNVNGVYKLVLVTIQSQFLRDYNSKNTPEWTISEFKVVECGILQELINR